MGEMIKETEQSPPRGMAIDQVNGATCTPSHPLWVLAWDEDI